MRTEITQQEANLIGVFYGFDPYVGKLTNGNYSMSKETYEEFKNTQQFKAIDFSQKIWKEDSEFDFFIETR